MARRGSGNKAQTTRRKKTQVWENQNDGKFTGGQSISGSKMADAFTVGGTEYTNISDDRKTVYNRIGGGTKKVEKFPGADPLSRKVAAMGRYKEVDIPEKYQTAEKKNKYTDQTGSTATKTTSPMKQSENRAAKANTKRKGRGSLRIELGGGSDSSASRLKRGGSGRKKRSSGAQGGGRSGLNIPR